MHQILCLKQHSLQIHKEVLEVYLDLQRNIVEEFNIPLPEFDSSTRKIISKGIDYFNNIINKL